MMENILYRKLLAPASKSTDGETAGICPDCRDREMAQTEEAL